MMLNQNVYEREERGIGRRGFTLLELIVVITIIGILGTFVLTRVSNFAPKARETKIKSDLKTIYEAAEMIHTQTGYWPESVDEMIDPKDENGSPLAGGLDKQPKDPWGNPYEYELREEGPVVYCLGKDGASSGSGEDKDLYYPEDTDESF